MHVNWIWDALMIATFNIAEYIPCILCLLPTFVHTFKFIQMLRSGTMPHLLSTWFSFSFQMQLLFFWGEKWEEKKGAQALTATKKIKTIKTPTLNKFYSRISKCVTIYHEVTCNHFCTWSAYLFLGLFMVWPALLAILGACQQLVKFNKLICNLAVSTVFVFFTCVCKFSLPVLKSWLIFSYTDRLLLWPSFYDHDFIAIGNFFYNFFTAVVVNKLQAFNETGPKIILAIFNCLTESFYWLNVKMRLEKISIRWS